MGGVDYTLKSLHQSESIVTTVLGLKAKKANWQSLNFPMPRQTNPKKLRDNACLLANQASSRSTA